MKNKWNRRADLQRTIFLLFFKWVKWEWAKSGRSTGSPSGSASDNQIIKTAFWPKHNCESEDIFPTKTHVSGKNGYVLRMLLNDE